MQDTVESWDKQAHNELVSRGLSWEHARIAVGVMAEQRQVADREGYMRGFADGQLQSDLANHYTLDNYWEDD